MSTTTTTTTTRSGARVRVLRIDDVIPGAEPIVSIMTGDLDVMSFSPTTARVLAGMLARAAATTVALSIRVENSYPQRGESFTHDIAVEVPAPADDENPDAWAFVHLIPYTGESGYARDHGVYRAEVVTAPAGFEHLVGFTTSAAG